MSREIERYRDTGGRMQIQANFVIKSLADAVPGELVRLGLHKGSTLAFVIGPRQFGFEVLALQSLPPNLIAPAVLRPTLGPVATYGADWILELLPHPDSHSGNLAYRNTPGVIMAGAAGFAILARERDDLNDVYGLDLETWQHLETDDRGAAPVPHWNLWANQASKSQTGASPLLQIRLQTPE